MDLPIRIETVNTRRPPPVPETELGFGRYFTDHMLRADYVEGKGWMDAAIVPYGPLSVDPAAAVLHYAQACFEGLKAYALPGGPHLFRPEMHAKRLNASTQRLCMPTLDVPWLVEAMKAFTRVEAPCIPRGEGTALYLRPAMIATEGFLGVRPAKTYTFFIIGSPVAGYFGKGKSSLRIWVERTQVRAARGGVGSAKAGANYVASLQAAEKAKARGFDQVLWLDVSHRYVEEVGTMNVFFALKGKLVTPALQDSLLAGVTRDTVLRVARDLGIPVEERQVELEELAQAHARGELEEAFGTGTAAIVSPVRELVWEEQSITLPSDKPGKISHALRTSLMDLFTGRAKDAHGWLVPVGA